MKVLRLIKGVNKMDKIRNTILREDLDVKPLLNVIEEGRLRWYGHVKRMEMGRITRKYMDWKPQGKRPSGRPRMRWMKGVETALEK